MCLELCILQALVSHHRGNPSGAIKRAILLVEVTRGSPFFACIWLIIMKAMNLFVDMFLNLKYYTFIIIKRTAPIHVFTIIEGQSSNG